jgi:hypothetical protein
MPIKSLLSEAKFNSDQTAMIAKAFDEAWAQLQNAQTEPAMASLVRTALAKRIIEMAECPGMNAHKPREDAVAYLKITRSGRPCNGHAHSSESALQKAVKVEWP